MLSATELPRSLNVTTIDLRDLEWITPFDVTALAVIAGRSRHRGQGLEVLPPADPQVRAYLVDIGLDQVLPAAWGPGGGSRIEPPLLRLTHLASSEAWDDLVSAIWPSVRTVVADHATAKRAIDIMSELVDNATTHGHSSIGTYACAQRYTGRTSGHEPGIWVGIADGGIGIPDHLRGNPRYADIADDAELIRLARRPWVTGTRDRRGWGLVEVFEDAAAAGPSHLIIRSGRGEGQFRLREGSPPQARYRPLRRAIPGAWVHVQIAAT
jgi:hypothetical protein